jgi:hypothetical protein
MHRLADYSLLSFSLPPSLPSQVFYQPANGEPIELGQECLENIEIVGGFIKAECGGVVIKVAPGALETRDKKLVDADGKLVDVNGALRLAEACIKVIVALYMLLWFGDIFVLFRIRTPNVLPKRLRWRRRKLPRKAAKSDWTATTTASLSCRAKQRAMALRQPPTQSRRSTKISPTIRRRRTSRKARRSRRKRRWPLFRRTTTLARAVRRHWSRRLLRCCLRLRLRFKIKNTENRKLCFC